MPDLPIPVTPPIALTQPAINRLNLVVTQYNVANGTSLDLSGWVHLHLRETAIQAELLASAQNLQARSQTDLQSAIQAERTRLLGLV